MYIYVFTLWKLQNFSLTEKIFCQINYLVISFVKPLLSRNFCEKMWERISTISTISTLCAVWKLLEFTLTFFGKNFVKVTHLLNKELIWREKISVRVNFSFFHSLVHTLWKLQNFTAMISPQKFRQINVLLKKFTIDWFDGKKFAWQWICRFSTLWCTIYSYTHFGVYEIFVLLENHFVKSII